MTDEIKQYFDVLDLEINSAKTEKALNFLKRRAERLLRNLGIYPHRAFTKKRYLKSMKLLVKKHDSFR